MRLKDRVAIVTGGGRGIGETICSKLAEEGARIAVADIDLDTAKSTSEALVAKGYIASPVKVDVRQEQSTKQMAEYVFKTWNRIDILINNAAIYRGVRPRPFYEIPDNEWDNMMAVNIKGGWQCAKAVFPYMKKQGKGKIINIATGLVFSVSVPMAHYIVSKGAVITLSRVLARELGPFGIRVNTVAPGVTMTDATKEWMSEEEAKKLVERRPIKNLQQPQDVANVVAFLCSDDSDQMTGQTLVVDGGGSFL